MINIQELIEDKVAEGFSKEEAIVLVKEEFLLRKSINVKNSIDYAKKALKKPKTTGLKLSII